MMSQPSSPAPLTPDAHVKPILEWLALAHGRTGAEDAEQLGQKLLELRGAPIPNVQRLKLLDLLFHHAERVAKAELPVFQNISLPVSRRDRQQIRNTLDLLAILTQDYFNTLAELFDPAPSSTPRSPHTSLRRAMQAIAWQARLTHLAAAPPPLGLWQQLHAAFRTARRLGQDTVPGPNESPSILRIYTGILLAAIAQPATFTAQELEFIGDYIACCLPEIELLSAPPLNQAGVFWLDPEKDIPAHALIRRIPGPEADILYFSCDAVAATANRHFQALKQGSSAEALGLPAFAGSHTGPGLLKRLSHLWGQPAKRRFPRRRQSYRAYVCTGLGSLWRLMKSETEPKDLSEWMVTNESPDGYALMHMSGQTKHLKVGDIVALQATEQHDPTTIWHICVIRWALSENPAHVEIGLQILAPRAVPVELATPNDNPSSKVAALILPPTPPLRPMQSLVVPTGVLRENTHHIVVLSEDSNLRIQEVHATQLDEQTTSIEIFTVVPEASP